MWQGSYEFSKIKSYLPNPSKREVPWCRWMLWSLNCKTCGPLLGLFAISNLRELAYQCPATVNHSMMQILFAQCFLIFLQICKLNFLLFSTKHFLWEKNVHLRNFISIFDFLISLLCFAKNKTCKWNRSSCFFILIIFYKIKKIKKTIKKIDSR